MQCDSGGSSSSSSPLPLLQPLSWQQPHTSQQQQQQQQQIASQQQLLLRLQILDGTGVERRSEVLCESEATVAQLKETHLSADIAGGWRPRCVYRGRLLGDSELLSQLPSGAYIQCYLQQSPGAGEGGEGT